MAANKSMVIVIILALFVILALLEFYDYANYVPTFPSWYYSNISLNLSYNESFNGDYRTSSVLDIEFLSDKEWRRKALNDELVFLDRRFSDAIGPPVPATIAIDTFEQPIKENIRFPIRLMLKKAYSGSIERSYKITSTMPSILWNFKRKCSPEPSSISQEKNGLTVASWAGDRIPNSTIIICGFREYRFQNTNLPSEILTIKADAFYKFSGHNISQ